MSTALVWFRQDLRLADNPAFYAACTNHTSVIPLYILDGNSSLGEAQSWWLHHSLKSLKKSLSETAGLNLALRKGNPQEIIPDLIRKHAIDTVYWNRCYEPVSIDRDKQLKSRLQSEGVDVHTFNASLFNEPWTVKNGNGEFYKVFTPYWKACRQRMSVQPVRKITQRPECIDVVSEELDAWQLLPEKNWASAFSQFWTPGEEGAQHRLQVFIHDHLQGYKINRDYPAKPATSHLSPHLHYGEISPWAILRAIEYARNEAGYDLAGAEHFLSELGWREFSCYLLYHFPSLPTQNFKPEFDAFPWQNDQQLLTCWQQGKTGFPLVDAGMRELWATGYMHNRVRMICASFLTKNLLIDWRLGADWFLNTLVDADLANNSAGWQWVAGCGADAAPYFRIFNPVLQSQKFDPEGTYIRRWVPELASLNNKRIHAPWDGVKSAGGYTDINYPLPVINHQETRARALVFYQQLKRGY